MRMSPLWGASPTNTCSLVASSWAQLSPKTCPTPLNCTPFLIPEMGLLLSPCLLGLWPGSQKHISLCHRQTALRRLATSHWPRHHPQMVGWHPAGQGWQWPVM